MNNEKKMNFRLTEKVIHFMHTINGYEGIEEHDNYWTYHRENGCETLDIDFRLIVDENGLQVKIEKSYDADTISGGHITEDTETICTLESLWIWLESNQIYSKNAHEIAKKFFQTVQCIFSWSECETEFYRQVSDEYDKSSCECADAIKVLLEMDIEEFDRLYIKKVWSEIRINSILREALF